MMSYRIQKYTKIRSYFHTVIQYLSLIYFFYYYPTFPRQYPAKPFILTKKDDEYITYCILSIVFRPFFRVLRPF